MCPSSQPPDSSSARKRVTEVARLFLRLGILAFGGPAAHIAMFHDETVKRRKWLDDQRFLDLLGITNLIPGPNSTEMAIHVGFERAGWPGLILGGACFIMPATIIVSTLAWAYVHFGSTAQAEWILYGVKPVVIAVIAQALWELGRKAVKNTLTAMAGMAVLVLYFIGMNEIALLFGGGLAVMLGENLRKLKGTNGFNSLIPVALVSLPASTTAAFSLTTMFLIFLKIGAILYGSGYVLFAFLRADFVVRLGWLTDQQLLDAIAVGQVTPGPVFTTATFIGYILGGMKGALLATIGIFLPSFVFVALVFPLVPRLRNSAWAGGFLDGVNTASLGLMAAVTWYMGRASLIDWLTVLITILSFGLLFRFKINATWLVLGGAAAGFLNYLLR